MWQGMRKSQNKAVLLSLSPLVSGQCQEGGTIGFVEDLKRTRGRQKLDLLSALNECLKMGPESSAALGTLGSQNFRLRLESIPALRFQSASLTFLGSQLADARLWDWLVPSSHKSISYNKSHFIYAYVLLILFLWRTLTNTKIQPIGL